jgi:hypothetical protein
MIDKMKRTIHEINSHGVLLETLLGKTIEDIRVTGETLTLTIKREGKYFINPSRERYVFNCMGGDCCSEIYIADICGDLTDLIGNPLLVAEVCTSNTRPTPEEQKRPDKYRIQEEHTWTFYKFATIKGSVTIRWLGTGNGYYSQDVTLERTQCAHPMKGEINDANERRDK